MKDEERERERKDLRNEHTVKRCVSAEEDGKKLGRKRGSGVEAMTDKMCPFSPFHPLYTSGVFICLFDILSTPSTIWINVSLYALRLIFVFFLIPSSSSEHGVLLCFRCLVCVFSARCYWSHFHQPLFPLCHCFTLFIAVDIFIAPSSPVFSSSHSLLHSVIKEHCHSPEFLLILSRTSHYWGWMTSWMSSPTSWVSPCLTPPIPSIWSSSGVSTSPGGRAVT